MIRKNSIKKWNKTRTIYWKKKDTFAFFIIFLTGLSLTPIGYIYSNFYDIFFSICLGLFIGGIILTILSTFLAQMESNVSGEGEFDFEMDVDADAEIDIDIDTDIDVDMDYDLGAEVELDAVEVDAEVDMDVGVDIDSDMDIDMEAEAEIDTSLSDITPAPILLLLSTAFLVFGISGIILFYTINEMLKFIMLFITPFLAYIITKFINYGWKKLAKSRYYSIAASLNLIGKKGEVILPIDERGGLIKVPSTTPLKFERLHVKPLVEGSVFERGDIVYICNVKNGYLLVDYKKSLIKNRR
ncbi:MAG: hypothetical protein ACFFA6_04705 [Promethearchaeota archaeon]